MFQKELFELLDQPVVNGPGPCGKVEAVHSFHAEHHAEPALQAGIIIFQGKVKDVSLPYRIVPKGDPLCDVVADLCHEERLPDLGTSREDVRAAQQASFNHRDPRRECHVVKVRHGHRFQIRRLRVQPSRDLACRFQDHGLFFFC